MRKLGKPDKPFEPRNDLEKHICLVISTMSNHDIKYLWTRQEYMCKHFDMDEKPMDPNFDYVVMSGEKHKDWFVSGNRYGINVDENDVTMIELLSYWNS